jgi:hypothetical protein
MSWILRILRILRADIVIAKLVETGGCVQGVIEVSHNRWRYLTNILILKLLLFAQSLIYLNPNTTVQENKAISYIAKIY